jgi:CpeT protein
MNRIRSPFFTRLSAVMGMCAALAALGCDGPPIVDAGAIEPARPDAAPAPTIDALRDASAWLAGHYSSAAQAAEDPTYFDVRLHIVPIWPDRIDGPWFYVEQAMASAQDKPYRQRIYRLTAAPELRVESVIYELPGSPLQWAGAWEHPERFNALDPAILQLRPGCSVVLAYAGPDRMTGGTEGDGCMSALRGAAYATSEVVLTPTGMETWDRGFDAANRQVWGATKGPYRFVKDRPAPVEPMPPEMPVGDEAPVVAPVPEPAGTPQ